MWADIASSFLELWRAQPPPGQILVIIGAVIVAALVCGFFWLLIDLVMTDVWPRMRGVRVRWTMNQELAEQREAFRTAALKRRELHRAELEAIVYQRFQR